MRQVPEKRAVTIVAGTFSYLHAGHRELLNKALSTGRPVIVGLTSDDYAMKTKSYSPPSFESRKKTLESYLKTKAPDFTIVALNNVQGDSTNNPYYENIAVSRETLSSAMNINMKRVKTGLKPMNILIADSVIARDYMIISSSRIARGEIDTEGNRISPMQISLTMGQSLNYSVLRRSLGHLFASVPLRITKCQTAGIFENEYDVRRNAMGNIGSRDYSILIREKIMDGSEFKTPSIAIETGVLDRNGYFTIGHSSSLPLNDEQYKRIQRSQTISPAIDWKKGYPLGKLISQSLSSAMYPRLYPWEFNMMGFHSTL